VLKVAIVGLGWWGGHLFDVIDSVEELAPVMGVDPTAEGKAFCDKYSLVYGADLDAALSNRNVDAVILATPHGLHKDQTLTALAAGKVVSAKSR
jgi:predicted dehydrogenase